MTESEADRLERLAALGPFFAVDVHDPTTAPSPGWRPFSDLLDIPGVLLARVEAARAVLATAGERPLDGVEIRVAASVVQLGLTARLLSPLLALASLADVDQVPALEDVRWQNAPGSVFPLSLPRPLLDAPGAATPDWSRWACDLIEGVLAPVSRAVAVLTPSGHVRQGNVASAIHGAVTVLASSGPDLVPPARAERARDLGRLLVEQPALRSAATGEPGTPGFRRRSCCLIYRVTDPSLASGARALCGDCVLLGGAR
jgi:hypothetical protein